VTFALIAVALMLAPGREAGFGEAVTAMLPTEVWPAIAAEAATLTPTATSAAHTSRDTLRRLWLVVLVISFLSVSTAGGRWTAGSVRAPPSCDASRTS